MAPSVVNVLLSSFPGLGLPSTLCIPISPDATISELSSLVLDRLPSTLSSRLLLSTTSGQILSSQSSKYVSSLSYPNAQDGLLLPVRLSVPICGGKGGFGSQLRAAGGRMSSRKKRANGENSGSNRNLDGRRLRTVNEAKALAEYLAVKPEMDKKERDERRKRWEQVVEAADKREEEIKSGKGKAKVDGAWVEEKEEGESKVRDAVRLAMQKGLLRERLASADGDTDEMEEDDESDSSSEADEGDESSSKATTPEKDTDIPNGKPSVAPRKIYGWDDVDEDSDEGTSESDNNEDTKQS